MQPVHFLLKPVTRERLSEALRADRELNHSPKTVTLQRGGRLLRLALSDIYYVETGVKHNVKIVTPAHAHLFPASLSYMEQALPAEQFVRCHKSYLVNLEHVTEVGRTAVRLDSRRGGSRRAKVRCRNPERLRRVPQPLMAGWRRFIPAPPSLSSFPLPVAPRNLPQRQGAPHDIARRAGRPQLSLCLPAAPGTLAAPARRPSHRRDIRRTGTPSAAAPCLTLRAGGGRRPGARGESRAARGTRPCSARRRRGTAGGSGTRSAC